MRTGGWLARRLAATVTLLHVASTGGALLPLARAHLERGVATLRELEVESSSSIRESESALDGILEELAEKPHDLVVIGGPARNVRAPFLRGDSVTRQVLRQCGCSVLVVREGGW